MLGVEEQLEIIEENRLIPLADFATSFSSSFLRCLPHFLLLAFSPKSSVAPSITYRKKKLSVNDLLLFGTGELPR